MEGGSLVIDSQKVALSRACDPAETPFTECGVEYICETTGVFLMVEKIKPHLKTSAKKVVFSAPAKDDSSTAVMGVNLETYDSSMTAVSCASCATNGLAPMAKAVIDKPRTRQWMGRRRRTGAEGVPRWATSSPLRQARPKPWPRWSRRWRASACPSLTCRSWT